MKFHKKCWIFICCFMLLLTGCQKPVTEIEWDSEDRIETEKETYLNEMFEQKDETEYIPATIFVDICGAVASPGVYELNEGARLYEAIEMAGGLLGTADDTMINRAEILSDGRKIQIFTKDEIKEQKIAVTDISGQSQGTDAEPGNGKVNINTADISLLTTLPGIGESRARDIIAYREEHGGFSSIEDIMNVNGIKDGTFHKFKDMITAE